MEENTLDLTILVDVFYQHCISAHTLVKLLKETRPTNYKDLIDKVCNSLVEEYVDMNVTLSTAMAIHTGVYEEELPSDTDSNLITTVYNVDELDQQYNMIDSFEDLEEE